MPSTSLEAQTFWKLHFRFCRHIVNVSGSSVDYGATGHGPTADKKTLFTARPENGPIMRGPFKHVTVHAEDNSIVCATDASSVLRHYVQDWLNVSRRAGDYAQDFTGRSLLLQRLI